MQRAWPDSVRRAPTGPARNQTGYNRNMPVKRITAQRLSAWIALAGQTSAAVRATVRTLIATTLPGCIVRFATVEATPAPVLATGSRGDPLPLPLPGTMPHRARETKTGWAVPASASPAPLHLLHPAAVNEAEPAPGVATEATLAAVDFLAQVDASLRFCYVSAGSIEFLGYHRDYLSSLTLHELVPSQETDELDALVARAQQSGKLETATLHLLKSLTTPILVELRVLATHTPDLPGFALAAFEISHWHDRETALRHALHHDSLTGLEPDSAEKRARCRPGRGRSHAHACGVAAGGYRRFPAH